MKIQKNEELLNSPEVTLGNVKIGYISHYNLVRESVFCMFLIASNYFFSWPCLGKDATARGLHMNM
jgi:hypothetical protein